ncbi:MAG: glutamate-5-semialdehyde dehydrogenase [Desulfopila sp.]|nr:glutamate-5-semialdehyde dehydrogenase [Desulfopila sp.]
MDECEKIVVDICRDAKKAARSMMTATSNVKNRTIATIAELIQSQKEHIQAENLKDIALGRENGLSEAMLDRLHLSDAAIDSMIKGLDEIVVLADPVGKVRELIRRPNGMMVGRMNVPLGVIGMIYESRPNVTVDAAVLCLKSGNSVILRGGSEAHHSNTALAALLQEALRQNNLNEKAIQVFPITDRKAIDILLKQEELVDLIIPRGGEGLIRYVSQNSRIPVLKHYKGVCHIYVDRLADLEKALPVILNSKIQRPGVCNALEGLLVHEEVAGEFLPMLITALRDAQVRVLGCSKAVALSEYIEKAKDSDWGTEFLDLCLTIKIVAGYPEAKEYIERYGSNHTECILTEDYSLAQKFIREIDASAVIVNASTRFNDGGQVGLGAEIGISTTKLHAYGPMGLEELTTRKFVVYGEGQVRD